MPQREAALPRDPRARLRQQRGDLRPLLIAQLRRAEARGKPISSVPRARQGSIVAGLSPTAKNVAALFMRREEKLDEQQEKYLKRLCDADEALADTRGLTQEEFAQMLRRLEGEDLDGWLKDAEESRSTALCEASPSA